MQKKNGFTLVELIVVIVIIGVLAAISIVSYVNLSKKALIASLQSDLDGNSNLLQIYYGKYGAYPTLDGNNCPASPTVDTNYCLKSSNNATYSYNLNSSTSFCLSETSSDGTVYNVTDNGPPTAGPCALSKYGSGTDGAITVSSSINLNTTNVATGRSCSDGGDAVNYSVTSLSANTATLSSSPSSGCLSAGDTVLLINQQGISSDYANVGNYEILAIQSVNSNTITFTANKTKNYGNGSGDSNLGTATTNQRVMLQRVPNYTNVTVNGGGSLTASAWNGIKGGVVAFKANNSVTIAGSVAVSSLGYREGGSGAGSVSGESRYGQKPISGNDCTPYDGGAGWTGGQTYGYLGGGGGGYGTGGQTGTNSGDGCPGQGGGTYGASDLSKIFLGSGGSGRHSTISIGGGVIMINGKSVTITGSVVSNGGAGWCCNVYNADGSGAGGSILIEGDTVSTGTNLVTANGGPAQQYGGYGGAGRIAAYYVTSFGGTTSPAINSYNTSFPF